MHATLAGTLISLLWVWIAYIHLVRMPFIGHLHCAFRNGVAASLCWIFIMATAQTTGTQATVVAAAGAPLAFVAVAGLSLLRARWAYKVSERFFGLKATLAASAKRVHKFWDCEEPEVRDAAAARVNGESALSVGAAPRSRHGWNASGNLRPFSQMLVRMIRRGNQQLAPEIIQGCGIAIVHAGTHFVDSPQVVMALAALQAFLENDIHAANSSVQKARGMTLSLVRRCRKHTLETSREIVGNPPHRHGWNFWIKRYSCVCSLCASRSSRSRRSSASAKTPRTATASTGRPTSTCRTASRSCCRPTGERRLALDLCSAGSLQRRQGQPTILAPLPQEGGAGVAR